MSGLKDAIILHGSAELVLTDAKGRVKQREYAENKIVTGGLEYITSRMRDAAATAMGWMAIGTSSTAVATGQTLLVAEVARVSGTVTFVTGTTTDDTYQMVSTYNPGTPAALQNITEAGIFNVVTASTPLMLNRLTFTAIPKNTTDTLTITWKIALSSP